MSNYLPPLSVYVHIPWCVRKCPYCDFNSHQSSEDDIPVEAFLSRFIDDLQQDAPLAQGRTVDTLFFGGGTPSLMPAHAIGAILEAIDKTIGFSQNAEITLEANPGTFEAEKFAGYRQAGVNRLSIGVQSFNDTFLKILGRIHKADEAIKAIEQAQRVGFDNYNIDLMHGLPGQSEAQALQDIQQAVALGPAHLSWYQLTIEQNTEFYRHPPALPEDDTLWAIQQAGQLEIGNSGFQQYEVSAYAKPGQESRHNLNYWRYGDYLGLGPGAHGKFTTLENGVSIVRTRKTRLPKDYLNTDRPLARIEEPVAQADRPFDYFINTLRLRAPVSLNHFEAATGLASQTLHDGLSELKHRGWIDWNGDSFSTTDTGYLYLNEVLSFWLDDA